MNKYGFKDSEGNQAIGVVGILFFIVIGLPVVLTFGSTILVAPLITYLLGPEFPLWGNILLSIVLGIVMFIGMFYLYYFLTGEFINNQNKNEDEDKDKAPKPEEKEEIVESDETNPLNNKRESDVSKSSNVILYILSWRYKYKSKVYYKLIKNMKNMDVIIFHVTIIIQWEN